MGLYSLSYCSCFCQVSCQGVCRDGVLDFRPVDGVPPWLQRRGLDTMFPSAASQTIGCDPHWSVMSSKWACTLSWGITFSIKVSNRNSGRSCLSDSSMSTVCCSSDPSCPVIPGGASRIFEWSLHGGAAVESIIMLGSRCPLIFSASSLGSTSQMSPM